MIYIYIYIYGCNLFVMLYDSVVLVWMTDYSVSTFPYKYCMSGVILSSKDNSYKIIHSSSGVDY